MESNRRTPYETNEKESKSPANRVVCRAFLWVSNRFVLGIAGSQLVIQGEAQDLPFRHTFTKEKGTGDCDDDGSKVQAQRTEGGRGKDHVVFGVFFGVQWLGTSIQTCVIFEMDAAAAGASQTQLLYHGPDERSQRFHTILRKK